MTAPARNITFDLIEHARTRPEATALIRHGQDIGYGELDAMVWRVAQYLHDQGVRSGQVVALTFQSEFFLALSLLALIRLGATTLTIRKSATPYEINQWVSVAHPSFTLSDVAGLLHGSHPTIAFNTAHMNAITHVNFKILCAHPEALLAIHLGSGSTGRAKLIPQTHAHMQARFELGNTTTTLSAESRTLCMSSLEFTGIQSRFLHAIHLGASHFVNDCPKELPFQEVLARNRINTLRLSVFHTELLLRNQLEKRTPQFSGIKTVSIGGSIISASIRDQIRTHICENLHVTYGTNEFGPISIATPAAVFDVEATVGRPLHGVTLEIVDEADQIVPIGQSGHVRVKSPASSERYFDDPEQTLRVFKNGWFYPGDMGKMTPNGELIHLGRSDQMMIYNGINIFPAEIETCMLDHPDVNDVVAFPMQHEVHQQVPVCAVALHSGVGAGLPPEALIDFARSRLGFKAPKLVFIVNHIPRTDMGKLIRPELFSQIQNI